MLRYTSGWCSTRYGFGLNLVLPRSMLMDSVPPAMMHWAIPAMMPAGKIFTTLEMKINYVRPITRERGVVRCEANVIHAGGRVATAEGRIMDEDGKLYAHGTATCILFRP